MIAMNSVSYNAHGDRARTPASVLRYTLRIHMVRSCEGEALAGANVAGARSQQARAASVSLTDEIYGSGFLRV